MGPTFGLKKCNRTLTVLIAVLFLVTLALIYNMNLKIIFNNLEGHLEEDGIATLEDPLATFHENTRHQLLTYGCVIKRTDPWDSRTRKYFQKESPFRCAVDQKEHLIDQGENGHLTVNFTALKEMIGNDIENFYCRKWTIYKNESNGSNKHGYGVSTTFVEFLLSTEMTEEFAEIKCFLSNVIIYTNYFFNVFHKPEVETECERGSLDFRSVQPTCLDRMSVLIIGIESVSRTNFMRQMPQTFDFMYNNLNAIDMLGYNRVASHSYSALAPSLTGYSPSQIPKKRVNDTHLFNLFQSAGYRTAFVDNADDRASFLQNSAHYDGSSLYSAMMQHSTLKSNCWRGKPDDARVLDWLSQFQKTFAHHLHFGYFWINRFSRLGLNGVQHLDPYLSETLRTLFQAEAFNNTLLVMLSGYGVGYGSYKVAEIGHQEENLPLMYLKFPLWFKEKFREAYENVQENRHRLVTLFDLYETVRDVRNCEYEVKSRKKTGRNGISFFKEISGNRTCEDAGILPIYCACTENLMEKNPRESQATLMGNILVKELNKYTKAWRHFCAEFRLRQVLVWRKVNNHSVGLRAINEESRSEVHYVKILVSPGELEFEVTFRFFILENNYVIGENIRRINYDRSTTNCIKNRGLLKMICYCLEK